MPPLTSPSLRGVEVTRHPSPLTATTEQVVLLHRDVLTPLVASSDTAQQAEGRGISLFPLGEEVQSLHCRGDKLPYHNQQR